MKPIITHDRHDRDDADMSVEQIVAGIRWLDATLADLQRAMAVTSRDDSGSLTIFRTH
jgi:hypothetical protein